MDRNAYTKEKTDIWLIFVPLAVMLFSFLGIVIFSMIYMAKDNNYENMIYQYFNISKKMYGKLIYLSITKDALVRGMNFCSLFFLMGNYMLFWFISSRRERKKRKKILEFLLLFLVLQAVIYSSSFQKAIYYGKLGFIPKPGAFRHFYKWFHVVTVCGNLLMPIAVCVWMIVIDLRKEVIPELWRIKGAILMTEVCMIALYYYLYFSLPDSFLWISRSTGYIAYYSLKMAPYVNGMRIVIYLIVLFLLILFYSLYRYQDMRRRVLKEEYNFSRIIASSEISIRTFSHYVKNELLGILAETELILPETREGQNALKTIQDTCREMYNRLNMLQENTNRIVLNQSKQKLSDVISRSIEENRTLLKQGGCEIIWNGSTDNTIVFLDPYYMREVFQNIFQNAMEAMINSEGEKKIYVRMLTFDDEVEISIEDTGPGLSLSVQNRLFEPFVSTKSTRQNWGVGLSFCKRIIDSHRGKIIAGNSEKGGAIFRIFLHVIEEEENGKEN